MDGRQHGVPTFENLRRIKRDLEGDIYNRTKYADTTYAKQSADRWQEALANQEENRLDQGAVDEINFVLDYFRPRSREWPPWAYVAFGAGMFAVLVLAALALVALV